MISIRDAFGGVVSQRHNFIFISAQKSAVKFAWQRAAYAEIGPRSERIEQGVLGLEASCLTEWPIHDRSACLSRNLIADDVARALIDFPRTLHGLLDLSFTIPSRQRRDSPPVERADTWYTDCCLVAVLRPYRRSRKR